MVVDYFTKWVEAEALVSITPTKIKEFIYKNIVCWYRVPDTLVSDNGTQFDCDDSRSRKSSHQSHDLRPMGRSRQ